MIGKKKKKEPWGQSERVLSTSLPCLQDTSAPQHTDVEMLARKSQSSLTRVSVGKLTDSTTGHFSTPFPSQRLEGRAFLDTGTAEPTQTGPMLFLTRHQVIFQRQQNKTTSHAAEACSEEKTVTSDNTRNQSFSALNPTPQPPIGN